MNIGIYDVDSKIPNLALMKISAHHKARNDTVEMYKPLWLETYDKVYASKVFDFSDDSNLLPDRMEIGGTGWNNKTLPQDIENLQPDYTLYNYPHNIGFTMRGCRFRCKFCVVPEKEGRPKANNTIEEIWTNRTSNFIVLLDNDFFGNPFWKDRIAEINELGLQVNFSQGLNIRIITDEQAEALASVHFRDMSGNNRTVYFAWDRINDEKWIKSGIERVIAAGIKPRQMMFYILVGYDTAPEEDMYRIEMLREYGCLPFVMPYDKKDKYQKKLARWANHKAIFKSVPWEQFA